MVTMLLLISVILEQFFIGPILPWLSQLGSVRPMIVFLDIPLALPAIDPLPVTILFALFYQIAPSSGLTRGNPPAAGGGRVWKAVTGCWMLLILLLAGGGLFFLAQDYLPKNISNGIDSFGIRADLTLPYPSGDLIHLHGSVVMLVFSGIGVLILRRRTALPARLILPEASEAAVVYTAPQPPAPALSSSVVSTAGTLIHPNFLPEASETFAAEHARYQPPATPKAKSSPVPAASSATATAIATPPNPAPAMATTTAAPPEKRYQSVTITPGYGKPAPAAPAPEPAPSSSRPHVQKPAIKTPEPPPTCRLTTPPPIAVVMPRAAPGIGKMHPCFVIGGLKPKKEPSTP